MRKSSRVNSFRATDSLKSSRSSTSSFKPQQLLVAVAQVFLDQFPQVFRLQDVVLGGGGDVHQRHARLDPVLEVDVFVEVGRRPEIDELDGLVRTADAVDTAEALDDAHRVPVDVVVDQLVAVLQGSGPRKCSRWR